MVEAPVRAVIMALDAMMADDARAMHGQHPMAASSSDKGGSGIDDGISGVNGIVVGGGIVIRVIVVIDAADKNPAEMTPVDESTTGISGTSISRDTSHRRRRGRFHSSRNRSRIECPCRPKARCRGSTSA